MIDKREILDIATNHSLGPQVVEKDYALGWVLAGIYANNELAESWIFKGGTCLKKCFFETYRFSEDLDFTLKDKSHINGEILKRVFTDVSKWVYEACGLELPVEFLNFEIFENARGNPACQGRLSYKGPISPGSGGLPRIKLDLTADERLVLAPVKRQIFHPYTDQPDNGIEVLVYAYEEAFGEKVRALGERTRPRDLYDVINLFRNEEARPAASVLLDVIRQKCEFKNVPVPKLAALETHRLDLEGSWNAMLQHQLPALPPFDSFWNELSSFFDWLLNDINPITPAAYVLARGETTLRERTLRLPLRLSGQAHIEVIRFAAANRLCVDLDYVTLNGHRSTRRIEPYSLRRTSSGNIILHAFNTDKNEHRSYRIKRITGARVTNQIYIPRYKVELTPQGDLKVASTTSDKSDGVTPGISNLSLRRISTRRPRSTWSSGGPTYIYECSYCGKKFRRKKQNSLLNKHKDKSGYPCSGRYGNYVDTQY